MRKLSHFTFKGIHKNNLCRFVVRSLMILSNWSQSSLKDTHSRLRGGWWQALKRRVNVILARSVCVPVRGFVCVLSVCECAMMCGMYSSQECIVVTSGLLTSFIRFTHRRSHTHARSHGRCLPCLTASVDLCARVSAVCVGGCACTHTQTGVSVDKVYQLGARCCRRPALWRFARVFREEDGNTSATDDPERRARVKTSNGFKTICK